MRKILTFVLLGFVTLFIYSTCAGGAKGKGKSDSAGNLKLENLSGVELVIYVKKNYKGTVKSGQKISILVEDAKPEGTKVDVDCFQRNKLTDLSSYPTNSDAMYWSFPRVVRPLSDPDPVILVSIPALSSEDLSNNAGVGAVLVRFRYDDFPNVLSAVSIFTGSKDAQNVIIALNNGDTKFAPMPVGRRLISMEYSVAGKRPDRKVYPETAKQMEDRRFWIYVPSGVTEVEHIIPRISEIYNINYVSNNPATRGTLRVRNQSSSQVDILIGGGTKSGAEEPINGADSVVFNNVPRKDFFIPAGNYYLRAMSAAIAANEIARIEDISIEPGMIYYWFIQDQNSSLKTGLNMSVPQQVNNWFQNWKIKSSPGEAKITLRIISTADGVPNVPPRDIGVTNGSGDLSLQNIDIGEFIRGLRTDNAKRVTLTLIAERNGYGSASQSISAYNLLASGTEFRLDTFTLNKINETEFTIGEPLIK